MKKANFKFLKYAFAGIAILFLTKAEINAQEPQGGIKGGLNLSFLSIEEVEEKNVLPGFHAGLWGRTMISEKVGIQPEILYSTKGVKTVYDDEFLGFDVRDGETKLNLSYVDIPVYLTVNLAEGLHVQAGPYVGVLLDAKLDTQAEILEFIEVDESDDIDRHQFNLLDYGITGGIGFGMEALEFGVNYNLGLNPVAKDGEDMEDILDDAKNHTIQVYVGLVF